MVITGISVIRMNVRTKHKLQIFEIVTTPLFREGVRYADCRFYAVVKSSPRKKERRKKKTVLQSDAVALLEV